MTTNRTDIAEAPAHNPFVRAFVAADINETVRQKLAAIQSRLKEAEAHVSWTRTENIHLSFAFLGDITHAQVPDVISAVDLAVTGIDPSSFDVDGVGFFGNRRSPRILWAGVQCREDLLQLQTRMSDLICSAGIELEKRRYRPHLTLGRVRSARGREDLIEAVTEVESEAFGSVDVTEIHLIESILKPTGAEYTVLHRARLNK